MQACRVLRNASASVRTVASFYAVPVRPSDHGRTFANAAPSDPTLHQRVSVLLQNTVSLLPRTLSTADDAVGPESSLFWSNILERSITRLSSGSDQVPVKATIAVCGFDKWARSHDLVTALLEDPFTSDATYSDILRNRWKSAPRCLNIVYGKPAAFAGELSIPSDWFQRFPHPIQLTELPELSSLSNISDETGTLLLESDVLVLLCDPTTTSLSDLTSRAKHLLDRPNTLLVLASSSGSDAHRRFFSRTLSRMECHPGHILFVDPGRALDAVTTLQADPTSPSTIDRYQRDTLGSHISALTTAINDVLSPKQSKTPLLGLRRDTALSHVHASLSASLRSVEATERDADCVADRVEDVSSAIHRIREDTKYDVFGKSREDNKVEKALALSAKDMNALLGSLSFWKLLWRVDEIGALVSAAVQGQWCKGLEHELILQTGRLQVAQRKTCDAAFDLVSTSSFRSPVLENRLAQLKWSPTHALTTCSLTQPIHDRRRQLIEHTTSKLHREAQSAVVGAFGGVLSGVGLGWWLAFGEHMVSLGAGTELGTAIGSGALLAVAGVRWAVGKWERAKRRWTQDAARIREGLARDLQARLQRTVDDNVTIVASTACQGMQDLVDRRRSETSRLREELCKLDTELHACAQFPASWSGSRPRSTNKVDK